MVENKEYEWKNRTAEWIKENPGKPTMYKEFFNNLQAPSAEKLPPKIAAPIFNSDSKTRRTQGIYVFICEPEKYAYVGRSQNMESRLRQHKMAILSNSKKDPNKTYLKIREHVALHSIESFRFIKHASIPNALPDVLNEKESEVMAEYITNGYTLYNRAMLPPPPVGQICCPDHLRTDIISLIKLCEVEEGPSLLKNCVNDLTRLLKPL